MPKNNVAVVTPKNPDTKLPDPYYAEIMIQNDALCEMIWPGDESKRALLTSENLFIMHEGGSIENIDPSVGKIFDNAFLGRLFARDNDGHLRQIQMEIVDNKPEFNVSAPVTIPEPVAPSFWTRVFAFFGHKVSKNAIQAYNDTLEFAGALRNMAEKNEYNINLDPLQEGVNAEANVNEPEVSNILEEHENAKVEEPVSNDLSEEEKDAFINELTEASKFTAENVHAVLSDEDLTHQKYLLALSDLLIAQVATTLLSSQNLNPNTVKPIFEGLKESVNEFLYTTYAKKISDIIIDKELGYKQPLAQKSTELVDEVSRTGLEKLLTYMNSQEMNNGKNFDAVKENIKQAIADNPAPSLFK